MSKAQSQKMRYSACPLCGNSDFKILLNLKPRYSVKSSLGVSSKDRIIYVCNNCEAYFSDDSYSAEVQDLDIDEMYDETYHDSLTGSVKNEDQSGVKEQNAFRINLLKQFASKEGDVLDIGCNTGHFLDAMQSEGYKVYGLEPSKFASNLARERFNYGEDRIETTIVSESQLLKKRQYDVITLWDVIEHFFTVKEDLKCIADALKENAVLVVRTPNKASVFFKLAIFMHKFSLGKLDFPAISIFHGDHNFFFSKKSLGLLFSELGLSVLKVVPDPLTWKRFRYCELHGRSFLLKVPIGLLYWLSRLTGGGHGVLVIAKKET